jgi:hypothetical protein
MRPGGGAAKGGEFERHVGRQLSLWLTNGQRTEIFTRNVMSGGVFTNALKLGKDERGMPGDLMAAHPLAFAFLSRFLVECKHLSSLGWDAYVYDRQRRSALGQIIALAAAQAAQAEPPLDYLVIARQNRRPTIVIGAYPTLRNCIDTPLGPLWHHVLHGSVLVMSFDDLTTRVRPARLLKVTE